MKTFWTCLLSLVALLLCWPALSQAASVSAKKLLVLVPGKAESNDGYDRDLFNHWIDADSNGCDTRQEVLLRQNQIAGSPCTATSGQWFSEYDGLVFTASRSLDIDHFIPLAESWGSGASRWSSSKRERYANDLYGYSLIAVSASSNRSKSDRDPAEWLPTRSAFVCRYLARWVAVKFRWGLSADSAERSAIKSSWSSCSAKSLQVSKIKKAL